MTLLSNNFNILPSLMVLSDVQYDDSSTFLIQKAVLFIMLSEENLYRTIVFHLVAYSFNLPKY